MRRRDSSGLFRLPVTEGPTGRGEDFQRTGHAAQIMRMEASGGLRIDLSQFAEQGRFITCCSPSLILCADVCRNHWTVKHSAQQGPQVQPRPPHKQRRASAPLDLGDTVDRGLQVLSDTVRFVRIEQVEEMMRTSTFTLAVPPDR